MVFLGAGHFRETGIWDLALAMASEPTRPTTSCCRSPTTPAKRSAFVAGRDG